MRVARCAARATGVGSTLWDLTIVVRTSAAGTEPPYLIDSRMLGVLYLGRLRADVDPYTGFKANLSTLRSRRKPCSTFGISRARAEWLQPDAGQDG